MLRTLLPILLLGWAGGACAQFLRDCREARTYAAATIASYHLEQEGKMDKEWFYGRGLRDDDARPERHELRKIVGILCIVGVLVGLFLGVGGCAAAPAAAPATDVPVYVLDDQEGGLVANLYATPCKDPRIVEFFQINKPKFVERLHEARTKFRMMSGEWRDYAGCWLELTKDEAGRELIYLHVEDGDRYLLPKEDFETKGTGV